MATRSTNPKIDAFLKKAETWRAEMTALRRIVLEHPLTEELKWGKPCYAFEGANVAIIIPFKDSCALMFCKGALLKDPKRVLVQPGEHSQSARWVKFTSVPAIAAMKPTLQAYLAEAIAAEKAGLKVEFKKEPEPVPEELQKKLKADPALKTAFRALTPGRQRAYILHILGAKQSATRASRVEKCAPQILAGKGLNDR